MSFRKRSYSFKEHGFYRFGIHFFKHVACDLTEVVKPDNAYLREYEFAFTINNYSFYAVCNAVSVKHCMYM